MTPSESNQAIALRLRSARLAQGLDLATLGRELKLRQSTLEAMECGDWAHLGAPVFARHLLNRYAQRLDVVVDSESVAAQLPDPRLCSQVPRSRFGRFAEFSARQITYMTGSLLVLPALYVLLVHWPQTGHSGAYALDPPVLVPSLPASPQTALLGEAAVPTAPVPVQVDTVAAGLTPSLPVADVVRAMRQIELRFTDESWIEIFGRDGRVLERVLAQSGEARRWPVDQVGRVTIGNADGTEVSVDGSGVNLESVRAANVARFALSSDGAIEAVPR